MRKKNVTGSIWYFILGLIIISMVIISLWPRQKIEKFEINYDKERENLLIKINELQLQIIKIKEEIEKEKMSSKNNEINKKLLDINNEINNINDKISSSTDIIQQKKYINYLNDLKIKKKEIEITININNLNIKELNKLYNEKNIELSDLKTLLEKQKPVDCVLSDWSDWSNCTKKCGGGLQNRTRSIKTSPQYGGKACDTVKEEQSCNKQNCPINCVLGWSQWTPCSKPCGGGISKRTNVILQKPAYGGAACGKITTQTTKCNTKPCRK